LRDTIPSYGTYHILGEQEAQNYHAHGFGYGVNCIHEPRPLSAERPNIILM